jgi:hypothetical protein
MQTFILILIVATGSHSYSGSTSVTEEFTTREKCIVAGKSLATDLVRKGNYLLTYGCFAK